MAVLDAAPNGSILGTGEASDIVFNAVLYKSSPTIRSPCAF